MSDKLNNACLLLRAIRDNDSANIDKYQKLTGIRVTDYNMLSSILRFWQIGMADSYQDAVELYNNDVNRANKLKRMRDSYQSQLKSAQETKRLVDYKKANIEEQVYGSEKSFAEDMKRRCDILREKIEKISRM